MLPQPDNDPPSASQRAALAVVSPPIVVDLRYPVVSVGLGHSAVQGAPVPEAAIDEDGDRKKGENEIGLSWQGRNVLLISLAQRV